MSTGQAEAGGGTPDGLEDQIAEALEAAAELRADQDAIWQALRDLGRRIDEAGDGGALVAGPSAGIAAAAAGRPGTPVHWWGFDLTDATSRHAHDTQLAGLTGFVTWLLSRFTKLASVLPECWVQHPALVEELTALWSAHATTYAPTAVGTDPLRWHEALFNATHRLSYHNDTGCSYSSHQASIREDLAGKAATRQTNIAARHEQ